MLNTLQGFWRACACVLVSSAVAQAAPTPYSGTPIAVPGTIKIEQFDNGGEGVAFHDTTTANLGGAFRQTGVDLETCNEGGYNVGWTAPGEWLLYSVNVATAGNYLLEARVASDGIGGTFHVEVGGVNVTGSMTIPNTRDFQIFSTISKTIALKAGAQAAKVVFDSNGTDGAGNIAWLRFTSTTQTPRPYTGTPIAVPGTLQAANFDTGGEGVSYHDTTAGNAGGAYRSTDVDLENSTLGRPNIGWTAAGEWIAYSINVQAAGTYNVALRVASPVASGRLHLSGRDAQSAITNVPRTGDWQIWTTMTVPLTLPAGQQLLTVYVDTGDFNIADLTLTASSTAPTAPPVVTRPYTGTAIVLPGTFQSVNFDNGGEGVGYHDVTAGNSGGAYRDTAVDIEASTLGGYNIGWTSAGEWLAYSVNVQTAGAYLVTLRVAAPSTSGRLHLTSGSTSSAVTTVTRSGDWQIWTTMSVPITLTAGAQVMTIAIDAGDFNIADVSVAAVGSTTTASPTPPTPPSTTTGGTVTSVPANGDLQAAINNAQPGDTLLLAAGATYVGNFWLPAKSGSSYITIRTSASDASLPDQNTRITPAYASVLPKLRSPNAIPALSTEPGAHHYRILGVEFLPTNIGYYDIIALGDGSAAQRSLVDVPNNLILDRVYVHGDPTYGQKRAIALNSASTTITNSYISEIKGSGGQDSQAIAGWNGPGPYTITNNYIEAAGENIMFGGADPKISQLVPSNITIRRNHITKQLAWRSQGLVVKNLLELKNAQDVIIDSNIFENHWADAQQGYALVFTPRNQEGGAPWSVVQNVQFTNNIVQHVSAGINFLGTDYTNPSQTSRNFVIRNNVFDDVSAAKFGGPGRFLVINGGSDIVIDHNTIRQDGSSTIFADGNPTYGFTLTSNIIPNVMWALIGTDMAPGNGTASRYFPGGTILDNAWVGASSSQYPGGNYFPASWSAVGFVNLANGDLRLAVSSLLYRAGLDGKDVGADIVAVGTATAGVKQ